MRVRAWLGFAALATLAGGLHHLGVLPLRGWVPRPTGDATVPWLLALRLAIGGEARVAAASFNLHGTCFTQPMDIRVGDGLADTACVAWGIERWMAAVVARWGGRVADWPAALR